MYMLIHSNRVFFPVILDMLCVKLMDLGLGPQQPVWLTCLGPAGKPLVLRKKMPRGRNPKGFDKSQARYCVKVRCYLLEGMQAVPGAVLWKHRHMYILREICVSVSQFTCSPVLNN